MGIRGQKSSTVVAIRFLANRHRFSQSIGDFCTRIEVRSFNSRGMAREPFKPFNLSGGHPQSPALLMRDRIGQGDRF